MVLRPAQNEGGKCPPRVLGDERPNYQQSIPQGSSVVERPVHTRKDGGAIPAPATIMYKKRQ